MSRKRRICEECGKEVMRQKMELHRLSHKYANRLSHKYAMQENAQGREDEHHPENNAASSNQQRPSDSPSEDPPLNNAKEDIFFSHNTDDELEDNGDDAQYVTSDEEDANDIINNTIFNPFDENISSGEESEGEGHAFWETPSDSGQAHHENKISLLIAYFLLLLQTMYKLPDIAVNLILTFLTILLEMTSAITLKFHSVFQLLGLFQDRLYFYRYVMCPKCSKLYHLDKLKAQVRHNQSPTCDFVEFKKHRKHHRRTRCNTPLLEKIPMKDGPIDWRGIKYYCYRSLQRSLEEFFFCVEISLISVIIGCKGLFHKTAWPIFTMARYGRNLFRMAHLAKMILL